MPEKLKPLFDFELRPIPVNGCPPERAHLYQDHPCPPGSFSFYVDGFKAGVVERWIGPDSLEPLPLLYIVNDSMYVYVEYNRRTGETAGRIVDREEAGRLRDPAIARDEGQWSRPHNPKWWARVFGISTDTIKRRFKDGSIRNKRLSVRSYRVHVDDLPETR